PDVGTLIYRHRCRRSASPLPRADMIGEIFLSDSAVFVKRGDKTLHLGDQPISGQLRRAVWLGLCRVVVSESETDAEAVGSFSRSVEQAEVIAENPVWSASLADAEQFAVDGNFEGVHGASLVRQRQPSMTS